MYLFYRFFVYSLNCDSIILDNRSSIKDFSLLCMIPVISNKITHLLEMKST